MQETGSRSGRHRSLELRGVAEPVAFTYEAAHGRNTRDDAHAEIIARLATLDDDNVTFI